LTPEQVRQATSIDLAEWGPELESQGELFTKLARTLPDTIRLERELLMARLKN
jgi:GTP-dependent phosphoenolpyruvate carboxykinase